MKTIGSHQKSLDDAAYAIVKNISKENGLSLSQLVKLYFPNSTNDYRGKRKLVIDRLQEIAEILPEMKDLTEKWIEEMLEFYDNGNRQTD